MTERAYRTKLTVNDKETTRLKHCCDVARFVYNWALADRKNAYENAGISIGYNQQKVQFNASKKQEFAWLLDTPYVITEYAFRDLDTAYRNFFRRVRQGTEAAGFPKFKSRHDDRQSFSVRGSVTVEQDRIKLPVLGWFRLMESGYIPVGVDAGRVTVTHIANDWWVSVQADTELPESLPRQDSAVGVDLGYGVLATLNDGTQYQNPRVLEQQERKLARLDRELKRRQRGGANYQKTKAERAKLHAKIARTRAHGLHDTSRKIVDRGDKLIFIEGYHVREMMEKTPQSVRKYARRNFKMADAAVGELRRQIGYKGEWAGGEVVTGDRFAPTNRYHCACGHVNLIVGLVEKFVCAGCGIEVERRLNSANAVIELSSQ